MNIITISIIIIIIVIIIIIIIIIVIPITIIIITIIIIIIILQMMKQVFVPQFRVAAQMMNHFLRVLCTLKLLYSIFVISRCFHNLNFEYVHKCYTHLKCKTIKSRYKKFQEGRNTTEHLKIAYFQRARYSKTSNDLGMQC